MTSARPRAGEIYRHFKGEIYQIVTIAKHSETGEELVIYQALYGTYRVYARELSVFVGEVDREKYPDASQRFRFERVELKEPLGSEKGAEMEKVARTLPSEEQIGQVETQENTEEEASPELLLFLDAETYNEKYKVLKSMEHTITDRLINDFAVILDVVIPEGEVSRRYEELKQCVATMAKYESTRLR